MSIHMLVCMSIATNRSGHLAGANLQKKTKEKSNNGKSETFEERAWNVKCELVHKALWSKLIIIIIIWVALPNCRLRTGTHTHTHDLINMIKRDVEWWCN